MPAYARPGHPQQFNGTLYQKISEGLQFIGKADHAAEQSYADALLSAHSASPRCQSFRPILRSWRCCSGTKAQGETAKAPSSPRSPALRTRNRNRSSTGCFNPVANNRNTGKRCRYPAFSAVKKHEVELSGLPGVIPADDESRSDTSFKTDFTPATCFPHRFPARNPASRPEIRISPNDAANSNTHAAISPDRTPTLHSTRLLGLSC
jgi:hypothetical protein